MAKASIEHLAKFKRLPSLPHLLLKLIDACNRSEVSFKDIANIIVKDPALTGKILRMVNSAHFGIPRKIRRLDQAVGVLGIEAIKNIAISSSIYEAFQQTPKNTEFNLKHFWWHSLRCALLSRRLAQEAHYPNPEEAFLVGLMHDIGRLLLWMNFTAEYADLLRRYRGRPELVVTGERRLVADHATVGAGLLEYWNLDTLLADAIRYHHAKPERIPNALPLVQILFMANALAGADDSPNWAGLAPILSALKVSQTTVPPLLAQVDEDIADIAQSLGIDIEAPATATAEPTASDREKYAELIRYAEQSALLFTALRNLVGADTEAEVVREMQVALATLFDFSKPLFFIMDPEQQHLVAEWTAPGTELEEHSPLMIPLSVQDSLVLSCCRKHSLTSSFDLDPRRLSILDQQIIRHTGKDGMVCQPLVRGGEALGVIVIGLDGDEFQLLNGNKEMLSLFADQAATSLSAITARRTRQQAIQDERLEAFTGLARKIVHEVNNPLGLIKNYLKILALKLGEQQISQDEIRIVNEEIDRVSEILGGLNTLSERKVVHTEAVNINQLIAQLCKIAGEPLLANSNIEIDLRLARDLPPVKADRNALRQVFVNLIKNAAEAMSTGGHLRIMTRCVGKGCGADPGPAGADSARRVEIVVADDGPGIPEAIRSSIFEPYVSSKKGPHSGLGLAIVHNIIKDLDGSITAESSIGQGTRFVVLLPATVKRTDTGTSER